MRYAIYYTPEADHPLADAATRWLGRSVFGAPVATRHEGFAELKTSPRRYGFHGTLKAPFRLADAVCEADLVDAFDAFCDAPRPVPHVRLVVGQLGPFFALVPEQADENLKTLAADCVTGFEPFRAQLTKAEIAKRKPETLTAPQREYLMRYGYPYVMDEFRFHMTLTGPVDVVQRDVVASALDAHFASVLAHPITMDSLSIFIERETGQDFDVFRMGKLTQGAHSRAETA
ncbi:MAG: DUF1045 domain-containing protein [Pseudomonadota bacterium]